ncbi:uncharacterized protein LOC123314251 [Coccinella septempunctata]|uniref:uncharacterized protein LOC123314251 n=1 Tax=Coccinella septempunctata TaxID=41139 RepID=UPI001D0689BD|nr:uncharacterized protein LOC123314251 [Coccinella septempunctata]
MWKYFCGVVWFTIVGLQLGGTVELKAYLSDEGLHGTLTFTKEENNEIRIEANLETTLQYPSQVWSWSLNEFPVDYTITENRCENEILGKPLVNLDDVLGYLILPDNKSFEHVTNNLTLGGDSGIYGKSILLRNVDTNRRICASITMTDKTKEKTAVARFNSPISGDVYFRWFSTKDNQSDMLITTDLYHVRNKENHNKRALDFTQHKWKIYATDILDSEHDRSEQNCDILQLVFDPDNRGKGKSMGDIDQRLGKVKIALDHNKRKFKTLFRDDQLSLLPNDLSGPQRRLYLVIFEKNHEDVFLACANIRYEHPINAMSIIQSGGVKGEITFTQNTKFEPTFLNFNLTTSRGDLETRLVYSSSVAGYKIHELPIKPSKTVGQNENTCITTKYIYNPLKTNIAAQPPNGYGTQDQYAIGDLSGKLLRRNNASRLVEGEELTGSYWDVYLPLRGPHSIVHRSLVIYKNTQYPNKISQEPWICGGISLYENNFKYQKPVFTAEVLFRYPTVGRMLFRQAKEEPWADTSILIEYLVHADGASLNNSFNHRWAIHELPPGKDFYDWQERCKSSAGIYNPYKVDFDNKTDPIETCNLRSIGICRLGDLSSRHGPLDIAGRISEADKISRKMWTDPSLPLSGYHAILGKSLVLYDDFGPKARGERLACSRIGGVYRRKAVVRDWFPNGNDLSVKGRIEFIQQTEYDVTNVEVSLEGLVDNSGYHIHVVPVEENLEFPCEETTLYGHWNPLNVDPSSSPRLYQGTPDQYEMGDLSGKFGSLDNQTIFKVSYNDTMLPIFGPRSILGRSVVIHKRVTGDRWACSTIERGYSPSEARELRAIASFHHPSGYAYGYMKMRQLIHRDGSKSDTTIEVKLRYPGKNDRNVTRDHKWAIYVNPVGVDAAVKTQNTRCVAGGYIWNPYFTQLADPLNTELYDQECGPENPLRCHVGDLSARLGTVDIGVQRKVFTDSNLPLEGDVTAVGRSIVILSPNRRPERFACANIEPDYDIVKYANIEKPPRFVLAQFIDDIREVMGIPEWFITVDSRRTKLLHNNACVQLLLHFKGPIANKLEQDFNRLLSIGKLEAPSLYIPGYIKEKRKTKISYKQCGVRDPNDKKKSKRPFFFGSSGSSESVMLSWRCTLFGLISLYLLYI